MFSAHALKSSHRVTWATPETKFRWSKAACTTGTETTPRALKRSWYPVSGSQVLCRRSHREVRQIRDIPDTTLAELETLTGKLVTSHGVVNQTNSRYCCAPRSALPD